MSNVIFEQWYEDTYGEKTFPNISDENNFKEACRAAYNFALDSKWNYNISEAPKNGTECLFVTKGGYIRKLTYGCIDDYQDYYSGLSLKSERNIKDLYSYDDKGCMSCVHIKGIYVTKDEDDYECINLEHSECCKSCIINNLENLTFDELDEFSKKYNNLFINKFTTQQELNRAEVEFLDKYGTWYHYDSNYGDISYDKEDLLAWKLADVVPEHLKG